MQRLQRFEFQLLTGFFTVSTRSAKSWLCAALRQATESTLPAVKFRNARTQILDRKIRPHPRREYHLRVRAFPQQKIAQPLLAAGADQQIDIGSRFRATSPPWSLRSDCANARAASSIAFARRIVDRQSQVQVSARPSSPAPSDRAKSAAIPANDRAARSPAAAPRWRCNDRAPESGSGPSNFISAVTSRAGRLQLSAENAYSVRIEIPERRRGFNRCAELLQRRRGGPLSAAVRAHSPSVRCRP